MAKSLRETWKKKKTKLIKDLGAKFVSQNFKKDLGPSLDKLEKGSKEIQKGIQAASAKMRKMSAADIGKTVQLFNASLQKIEKESTESKKIIREYTRTIRDKAADKGKTQIVADWPNIGRDLVLAVDSTYMDAELALNGYREEADRRYAQLREDAEALRAAQNYPLIQQDVKDRIKQRDKASGNTSKKKLSERPYEQGR